MHDKINISFHSSDCPEESQLRAYQNGQLLKSEIRVIEEHLVDCEMCSDYLEGLSLLTGSDELDKEAAIIISKINSGTSKKNRLWLYATAASIFIGISLFSVIWFIPSKTNFVADKLEQINASKDGKPATLNDSTIVPSTGFINNQSEVVDGNKSQADESKVISQTVVDQVSPVQFEVAEESIQQKSKTQDLRFTDQEKESEQKITVETKNITTVTSDIQEKQPTTSTGAAQTIAGGVCRERGLLKDESAKAEKSEKKSNRKESKDKEGVAANAIVLSAEEAPAAVAKGDIPGKEADFFAGDTESNIDLDKSRVFINQQMTDSAVVYALRAITSCDSCKWTAMFVLSKAYITAGQTEKAVATLKEITAKAPSKYSKEAKVELEKLGY